MTGTINFIINNRGLLLLMFIITVIGTALLTFHYFFIYQYVINKRLQNPDKTYQFKWLVPKFACMIFAALTFFGSLFYCNSQSLWMTQYEFTDFRMADDIKNAEKNYTYDELKKNSSYTLYELNSNRFKYSLFYNNDYNGIINNRSFNGNLSYRIENCEYIIFVDCIDSNTNSDDIYDTMLYNKDYGNIYDNFRGSGVGMTELKRNEFPLCIYGSTDEYDGIEFNLRIYTKSMYSKINSDLYDESTEYDDSSELNEYGEKDYWYLSESFSFDVNNKKISKIQTKELKENL